MAVRSEPVTRKRRTRRRRRKRQPERWSALPLIEAVVLASAALLVVIDVLGRAAARLSGVDLWRSLVPFAAVVLALALGLGAAIWLWLVARAPLRRRRAWLPMLAAATLASGIVWLCSGPAFESDTAALRALLGGRAEAERRALAHQAFAAYRRTPPEAWKRMLERAAPFEAEVRRAAAAFAVDAEILMGVAAAESGFKPRDSSDGGRGLFQITTAPAKAMREVRAVLGAPTLDPRQTRDNAHLAAATLRSYLAEMNGDLFLALLAYNMGPRNGGLLAIMQQYGAGDFVTIQPYLQNLPRDYPIRVLSAALAYRLLRREGSLPRYEDGDNALRIQRVGVPGLE